jgi:hypothetical protein
VITPFRRLVLASEDRARVGDRFFPQREAFELLAAQDGAIDVVVELTFHPLNTYIGVPDYEIALEDGPRVRLARNPQRLSRFTPRVAGVPVPSAGNGLPNGSQPLLGGTVIARFERADINVESRYDVVLLEYRKELARARIDLAVLR